jgi:hypothetical protein
MRLFQNSGVYPSYLRHLNRLAANAAGFGERRRIFLNDRYGALHFLQPVLDEDEQAFFTNGDDEILQRLWARKAGMKGRPSLKAILLAQIEQHRTEVFYNLDPVSYPSAFVRELPRCVKTSLCWRAAPSGALDLTGYGAVLGNFPSILKAWRDKGCRAEMFYPALDPVMASFGHDDRPIDVLFIGGYSRHHARRARTLEEVAKLAGLRKVAFHLDASRLTAMSESVVGRFLPLKRYRRPEAIANIARPPVFGSQQYDLIGKSKIVLNGAIDMAGLDRGNMRCFEAMGCGALLLSDAGNYPAGMTPGVTMEAYASPQEAVELIVQCLENWRQSAETAARGRKTISELYNKSRQWQDFISIVARI